MKNTAELSLRYTKKVGSALCAVCRVLCYVVFCDGQKSKTIDLYALLIDDNF